mmetsp:Transcript_42881/g.130465  ORF Transcript_42881/g.130465 Transcript_42881/m.130465 type:complete len:1051 (-) Transcript_42881:722-3874(-)
MGDSLIHVSTYRSSSSSPSRRRRHRSFDRERLREPINAATYEFNVRLNDLARRGDRRTAAGRAQDMLLEAVRCADEGACDPEQEDAHARGEGVIPNVVSFSTVMNAWARSYDPDAAANAEELLRTMERIDAGIYAGGGGGGMGGGAFGPSSATNRPRPRLRPNSFSYNSCITAWARCRSDPSAARRAECLLDEMEVSYCNGGGDETVRPNALSYSGCISAWARSDDPDAATRAASLLERMERLYRAGDYGVMPDTVAYTSTIQAWSRVTNAADRADELLERMMRLSGEGGENPCARPNVRTYNYVLASYARTRGRAGDAERMLRRMEQASREREWEAEAMGEEEDGDRDDGDGTIRPDTGTYNACIAAWCRQSEEEMNEGEDGKDSLARAESLLREMRDRPRTDGDGEHDDEADDVRPDVSSYGNIIRLHCKRNSRPAARRASELLDEMERSYESGDAACRPRTFLYNFLLNSYATLNDAESLSSVRSLLNRMEGRRYARPDRVSYNSVLKLYAQQRRRGRKSASDACALLDEMTRRYERDGERRVKPDRITYSAVISALTRSGAPGASSANKAEELLERMLTAYRNGDEEMKPNKITFSAVMNCIADGGGGGAGGGGGKTSKDTTDKVLDLLQNCLDLFRETGDDDFRPDTVLFNCVLKQLARCRGRRYSAAQAEAALAQMERLRDSGTEGAAPDLLSFNICIDAYANGAERGIEGCAASAERLLERVEAMHAAAADDDYDDDRDDGDDGDDHDADDSNRDGDTATGGTRAGARGAFRPDHYTYNSAIKALAGSREPGAAERAHRILERMESLGARDEDEDEDDEDDVNENGNVDKGRGRGNKGGAKGKKGKGGRTMPDSVTYSTVINGYANGSGGGTAGAVERAEKAESLLRHQERLFEEGNIDAPPGKIGYTAVIKAWSMVNNNNNNNNNNGKGNGNKKGKGNKKSGGGSGRRIKSGGGSKIKSVSGSGGSNGSGKVAAAERAESLLREMVERFENGDDRMRPTRPTFATAFAAARRTGDGGSVRRIEALKAKLEDMLLEEKGEVSL